MSPDFHDLAHAINNLNQGINLAIEEKTKSELFKTELITNVSHDIKTRSPQSLLIQIFCKEKI